jgi:hypothetical protein
MTKISARDTSAISSIDRCETTGPEQADLSVHAAATEEDGPEKITGED